ncbi:DNA-binding transcriptional MerR regulator [Lipingzhangella halophila]|uniref:DNA-binding transcriptional MerR regulator n=1 Tax=Lipingzhangella halophila TaxID=1783352 RepID=A0A7W7W3V4_9ACTN|nr:MerR family transcriptional regulator [Lipingzhangella halophila]MBB4933166.1 DNA-binding transcriptional MerR regulator [Lipingzhangella halophila]
MNEVAVHIGELSERTGVSRRSLRYYEQRGLLHARRTDAGWREYDEEALVRVRNVADLLEAGMTVEDIREVAPCLDQDEHSVCGDPDGAIRIHEVRLRVIEERLAKLREHRDRLVRRIARIRDTEARSDGGSATQRLGER